MYNVVLWRVYNNDSRESPFIMEYAYIELSYGYDTDMKLASSPYPIITTNIFLAGANGKISLDKSAI